MDFILMRHGHTIWNGPPMRHQGIQNSPLSPSGLRNAESLAGKFEASYLISSPAGRCLETCQAVFQRQPDMCDPRLWELNMGWFAGLTREEVAAKDPEHFRLWQDQPDMLAPGDGETLAQLQDRVFQGLLEGCHSHSSEESLTFLVHGGVMRVMVCLATGLSLGAYHRLRVENLCRMRFSLDLNTQKLEFHGDIPFKNAE